MEQLARRILSCQGPSGPNRVRAPPPSRENDRVNLVLQDYLYHLAASVRELYPHLKDDYLFELEVREAVAKGSDALTIAHFRLFA